MDRHPFDPVSLVFGGVFALAGLILVAGGEITDDGRFLLPVALIGLGVAVITQAGSRAHHNEDAAGGDPAMPESTGEDGTGDEVGAEGGEDREIEEAGRSHDS